MYFPVIPVLFSLLALVTYVAVVRAGTKGEPFSKTWYLYAYALAGAAVVTFIALTLLT